MTTFTICYIDTRAAEFGLDTEKFQGTLIEAERYAERQARVVDPETKQEMVLRYTVEEARH